MLVKAPPIMDMGLTKSMEHFNSNEYLKLPHNIQFPVHRGCSKSGILCAIRELVAVEMIGCKPLCGFIDTSRRPSHPFYESKEGYRTLQQQWLYICATRYPMFLAGRVLTQHLVFCK